MRKLVAGLALGLGSATLVALLASAGSLETAELKTYDWRMRSVAALRTAGGRAQGRKRGRLGCES